MALPFAVLRTLDLGGEKYFHEVLEGLRDRGFALVVLSDLVARSPN